MVWLIYIGAVNNNQLVEASLAYFINPLVTILFGLVFFKERLSFWQFVALFLAFVGVAVETIQYGQMPWLALTLALLFGLYGLVKKQIKVDPFLGLAFESLAALPVALFYLVMKWIDGTGSFGLSLQMWLLLIFSGVVSAVPLYWFAQGAKVLPLSTMGLSQYLAPSISLIIAVYFYKEPFMKVDLIAFGFIWCACTIYSISLIVNSQSINEEKNVHVER